MGKMIKITKEAALQAAKEFYETISSSKFPDGKISYTRTMGVNDAKTTVYFTAFAWTKMVALIHEFNDEVAWHGLAKRSEEGGGFVVYDILVYPQEVTGATVNTDQEKYQTWLMQHEDDVFNNIRMQGHSHVNMGTFPSSVDITHQEKILEQLDDSMFYIFMIWNKKMESSVKVYDLANNTLYEGNDVDVRLMDAEIGLNEFINGARAQVTKKVYTYTAGTAASLSERAGAKGAGKNKTTVAGGAYTPPKPPAYGYNYEAFEDDSVWANGGIYGYGG
jgi:hypothetical protein